jgi:uncharacterized protein
MKKKIFLLGIMSIILFSSFCHYSTATIPGDIQEGDISLNYRNVTVYAPAVAQTESGYTGVISTITVTIQNNGSGRVFVDTLPLTQIDMQGSARLAVKVAGTLVKNDENCSVNPSEYDYFFVVRTSSPIIGGPSAGAIMTVATVALLENWPMNNFTIMTGMINPDGSIGPVGGIVQKIDAAASVGATRFLIPKGQGTYTDLVTETIVEGNMKTVITRSVVKNVADYALDTYGIEVIEVEDINEAVYFFTGYNFTVITSDDNITTQDYSEFMKPLASTLLEEAENLYNNASELFDNTSIPNYYPTYYRSQIGDILNTAEEILADSKLWFEEGLYYSSTTKSFQSLINSRTVFYACEYYNSENNDAYISSLLDEVGSYFNNESVRARSANIDGIISLQCIGAAQTRASDAEQFLSEAEAEYNSNNYDFLSLVYKTAFTMERSRSVGWWIGFASYFNETGIVNMTVLENLAAEYIEDAQQASVYSSVILQQIGEFTGTLVDYLTSADELLAAARDNLKKDYPAAALFESLKALVRANLAIEMIDTSSEDKIDRARDSASSRISQSRLMGMEPLLAVSYYELGQVFANESNYDDALIYFKYSGIIAGALGFTNFSSYSASTSRFVGTPEVNLEGVWWFNHPEFFFYFAIVGALAGLGIGLIIGSLLGKQKKKDDYNDWTPRSIEDYYKKHK